VLISRVRESPQESRGHISTSPGSSPAASGGDSDPLRVLVPAVKSVNSCFQPEPSPRRAREDAAGYRETFPAADRLIQRIRRTGVKNQALKGKGGSESSGGQREDDPNQADGGASSNTYAGIGGAGAGAGAGLKLMVQISDDNVGNAAGAKLSARSVKLSAHGREGGQGLAKNPPMFVKSLSARPPPLEISSPENSTMSPALTADSKWPTEAAFVVGAGSAAHHKERDTKVSVLNLAINCEPSSARRQLEHVFSLPAASLNNPAPAAVTSQPPLGTVTVATTPSPAVVESAHASVPPAHPTTGSAHTSDGPNASDKKSTRPPSSLRPWSALDKAHLRATEGEQDDSEDESWAESEWGRSPPPRPVAAAMSGSPAESSVTRGSSFSSPARRTETAAASPHADSPKGLLDGQSAPVVVDGGLEGHVFSGGGLEEVVDALHITSLFAAPVRVSSAQLSQLFEEGRAGKSTVDHIW
jgi:hypothetical protein